MTTDDLGGIRIASAAALLGYDKSTIRRKIAAGDLETYGSGVGTRVTLRSIRAYQNGERGTWRKEKATKPLTAADQSLRVVSSRKKEADPAKPTSPYAGVRPRART